MSDTPAWDLSPEYSSFDDPRFTADLGRVREIAALLEGLGPSLEPALDRADSLDPLRDAELLADCRRALALGDECSILFGNLAVYANCVSSLDGGETRSREYRGVFRGLAARLEKAESSLDLLLARGAEAFVAALLGSAEGAAHAFRAGQLRKYRARLLPLAEEKLLASLAPDGHGAWSELYDNITGTAKARLGTEAGGREIGLAEAASLAREGDPVLREAGWRAQTEAFARHEESLAAILNAIAGWRLAEYGLRSGGGTLHFLDPALAQNRMTAATLEALMSVVDESRELGRRAIRAQARLLGLEKLACWDLLAPAPAPEGGAARTYGFAEGLELVRGAYAEIEPAMGDFVLEMRDSGRIEARVLPSKRPGAYCTSFPKSRRPRVFQTYRGSLSDVSTLAHELGHAYHGKLLADLPLPETRYPMTLAETASTFAETALGDFLAARAGTGGSGLAEVLWSDAQDAATFLVNIPARFAFEKRLYERRAAKPLGPAALTELMLSTWEEYYGDSLSVHDGGFWKSKLHFYMTGRSFYNFPYTFGYLFSLGVYARRKILGKDFHAAYAALLRDTGRMEAEELARRHLGADISAPGFWRESVGILRAKVERFEDFVAGGRG